MDGGYRSLYVFRIQYLWGCTFLCVKRGCTETCVHVFFFTIFLACSSWVARVLCVRVLLHQHAVDDDLRVIVQ